MAAPLTDFVIAETRAWVERAVIGLNLCPFAKAPQIKGSVRYVVSAATEAEALLAALVEELALLANAPDAKIETTLLIHPGVLNEFAAYNDFLDVAEGAIASLNLDGVIQVASFHPHYRFADQEADDLGNATNRSPYPTLHLIREAAIDRAVAAFPDAAAIYSVNIETMNRLGAEGWADLQRRCREDAAGTPSS